MVDTQKEPVLFKGGLLTDKPLTFANITQAQLPPAVNFPGGLAYTSDNGLVYSDGASWLAVGAGGFSPYAGATFQDFEFFIRNNAGTIQHKIISQNHVNPVTGGVAATKASAVSGASSTAQNTPTGADASTAFVAGAKISSANPHMVFLNTVGQVEGESAFAAEAISTNGLVHVLVSALFFSADVNGVTLTRPALVLTNTTTAAGINWATQLNDAGDFVRVGVRGWLKT